MSKLFSVLLAALLLAMVIVPASAAPPEPAYYSVVDGGPCWLPDGKGMPARVSEVKQSFDWTAPLHLAAVCFGELPKGASRPNQPVKLTYEETGYVCEVLVGRVSYKTVDYGAIIYPNGATEITCRVQLD